MIVEIIGIVASCIILLSGIFKSSDKRKNILMRSINTLGSIVFVVYGCLISSTSIILLNSAMILTSIYHVIILIRELRHENRDSKPFHIDYVDIWINKSDDPALPIKHGVFGADWAGSPGCGRWQMILDEKGTAHIYTECMDSQDDKAFSEAILKKLLEEAIIEE